MSRTMRAVLASAGEWQRDTVDAPRPGAGQVLVAVRAAGINRADLYMLDGEYNPATPLGDRFIAGIELAGEVAAVGEGVTDMAVGARVMGGARGAFADYAVADHRHLLPIPAGLSWVEAAALPVGLTTEYDALVSQAGFRAGQAVLVLGATSSVGVVGLQLARALGARLVIGTTTAESKVAVLKQAGADLVVNTATDVLAEVVGAATDGSGVDVVLDHLGGTVLSASFTAVRIGGIIIGIGRLAGHHSTIDLDQLAYRRLRIHGTTFSIRTAEQRSQVYAAVAAGALPWVEDGTIRPIVDRVFSFEDARAAGAYVRSNQAVGKVVLDLS